MFVKATVCVAFIILAGRGASISFVHFLVSHLVC